MREFPPFRLDTVNQCLWRGDGVAEERIPLAPKALPCTTRHEAASRVHRRPRPQLGRTVSLITKQLEFFAFERQIEVRIIEASFEARFLGLSESLDVSDFHFRDPDQSRDVLVEQFAAGLVGFAVDLQAQKSKLHKALRSRVHHELLDRHSVSMGCLSTKVPWPSRLGELLWLAERKQRQWRGVGCHSPDGNRPLLDRPTILGNFGDQDLDVVDSPTRARVKIRKKPARTVPVDENGQLAKSVVGAEDHSSLLGTVENRSDDGEAAADQRKESGNRDPSCRALKSQRALHNGNQEHAQEQEARA